MLKSFFFFFFFFKPKNIKRDALIVSLFNSFNNSATHSLDNADEENFFFFSK